MTAETEHIQISGKWPLTQYRWKTGGVLDKFVQGLRERQIYGTKCSGCGTVFVPPSLICPRCQSRLKLERKENWIRISDKGIVVSYTISHMTILGGLKERPVRPIYIIVKLDDTDTSNMAQLMQTEEDQVHVGMRIKVDWPDNPKGALSDIFYFKPLLAP